MKYLMKSIQAIFLSLSFLLFTLIGVTQNSISETFSTYDIATTLGSFDPACNASGTSLSITLPAGQNVDVDSVSITYAFQAVGALPPSAQQSQIFCASSNQSSAVFGNTNGAAGALESYQHNGLTIANGTYAGGSTIEFEMRAWKTFGANNCGSTEQYIPNNSWAIILYHSDPYDAPKVGVNTTTPEATLDVAGKIKIADDLIDPVEGMIKYDVSDKEFLGHNGTEWKAFTSSKTIADDDADTKIDVESTADDDVIRLISQDSMGWEIYRSNLKPVGTNGSVYIGEGAGENGEAAVGNIAIGENALQTNIVSPGNVAVGDSALFTNGLGVTNPTFNSASSNTAVGSRTLVNNTTGFWNTAVGGQALYSNTNSQANTAIGFQSLYNNTSGSGNQALGLQALFSNKTGGSNLAIGNTALYSNVNGIGNVAIGLQNLYTNTANFNTSVGYQGMKDNTTGNNNTVLGYGALRNNTIGNQNTSLGMLSLAQNTTGNNNAAVGYRALYNNTTGENNIAMGTAALYSNTERSGLVAIGDSALYHNGIGSFDPFHGSGNIAIGHKSLYMNDIGFSNIAIGANALQSTTNGRFNIGIGKGALSDNITGNYNLAIGLNTLVKNTSGTDNIAFGVTALYENTTGFQNVAIGGSALFKNETASGNISIGFYSMRNKTTGNSNVAFGSSALRDNISGTANVAIGSSSNSNGNENNTIALGYLVECNADNQARIGNINITSIGGYAAWTNVSDARFKSNIQENVIGLDFIKKLKPVTYKLNQKAIETFQEKHTGHRDTSYWETKYDHSKITQSGFLAQDVEAAAQALGYDFNGVDAPQNEEGHYGLRYSLFTVPLVKAVQELAADDDLSKTEIDALQKKVIAMESKVKIRDEKIAQLESKVAAFEKWMQSEKRKDTVNNNVEVDSKN